MSLALLDKNQRSNHIDISENFKLFISLLVKKINQRNNILIVINGKYKKIVADNYVYRYPLIH